MKGRGGGGKRPPSKNSQRSRPPFKKAKRSKKFWQQRQTVEIATVPKEEEEADSYSSGEDGEVEKNNYETLLAAFPVTKKTSKSSDEDEG